MRLLLIDDDPRYRTLLRHHISCDWPDVDIVSYNPRVRGPLTPGFLAQGYSAVLLDHEWKGGGSGAEWLKDFQGRDGFAPVIFLASDDIAEDAEAARAAGAFAVLGKKKCVSGHRQFCLVGIVVNAVRPQEPHAGTTISTPRLQTIV